MKYLALLFVVLCFSCKQEEPKRKIEIYLLKTRVESYEGSRTLELAKFDTIREEVIEAGLAQTRYDTIKNEFVFAGKFIVTLDDLMEKPFITDGQILKLDIKKMKLGSTHQQLWKCLCLNPIWDTVLNLLLLSITNPSLQAIFGMVYLPTGATPII